MEKMKKILFDGVIMDVPEIIRVTQLDGEWCIVWHDKDKLPQVVQKYKSKESAYGDFWKFASYLGTSQRLFIFGVDEEIYRQAVKSND